MIVYKDHSYLIFDLGKDGVVKYDFARKMPIGKKGMPVSNLKSQLSGITMDDVCSSCRDEGYGKFLHFVMQQGGRTGMAISNIGTILENVPRFSRCEQFFSAGINVDGSIRYNISEVPKGLLKICRTYGFRLTNVLVDNYRAMPDACNLMFSMKFVSLTLNDLLNIMQDQYRCRDANYNYNTVSSFGYLLSTFGYQAKPLLNYIDALKTYEALEDMHFILVELRDYAKMMNDISRKFDRYPKHFLTTHRIASRNYTRLKTQFDEDAFAARVNKEMENTIGQYAFIYPNCTQDIKDEAVQQNNCVASYIKRVIDGQCDIMFMRSKNDLEKSLVTLEVVDNRIVQAKQHFNYKVTPQQADAINKWNLWYGEKMKMEERKSA